MELLPAIALGVVEGATEFLPISSTFHLIWAARLLGIAETDFVKLFEVVIQSGAVLAVLALYLDVLRRDRSLVARVAVSFVPTAVVGLVLYRVIKSVFFEQLELQLAVFIAVGIAFISLELAWRGRAVSRTAGSLSYVEAALVGVVQALAVVPGVSRAGAVIVGMLVLGVRRDEAARYSFLLAVPTVVAAGALDLWQMRDVVAANAANLGALLAGLVVSFVVALAVVRWFVRYLQSHTLVLFGVYRLAVGLALFVLAR